MGLIVPALRFILLLLNIYDSYKTLKIPQPSTRNGGQPSQRALSQRKRDMKGCLTVWIVWCCLMTYEGALEAIVSLFVPFYDEIKSLALLFLIMTRARGAEPIYLHILRPLLKPYIPTLDLLLDFVRMIGDILINLVTIPIRFARVWWRRSMFYTEEVQESAAGRSRHDPVGKISAPVREQQPFQFPKKITPDRRQLGHKSRPSSESSRLPSEINLQTLVTTSSQHVSSNGVMDGSRSRQIWYPPPPPYSDDEDDSERILPHTGKSRVGKIGYDFLSELARREQEEWRQYPAFPSAYPPTPIVHSVSRLPPTTITTLSGISEFPSEQDSRESPLPPNKAMNPGLSDDHTPGVQISQSVGMSVESESEDESDDAFNVTLKTPMPPLRMTRYNVETVPQLDLRATNVFSISTRSTTLSTADSKSSLRTQSSLESLSSGVVTTSDLSSTLGKKRPLPSNTRRSSRLLDGKNRLEDKGNATSSGPLHVDPIPSKTGSRRRLVQTSDVGDAKPKLSFADIGNDHRDISQKQKHSLPKRRKIT